jgi:mono/diheme cytochrome c family protein
MDTIINKPQTKLLAAISFFFFFFFANPGVVSAQEDGVKLFKQNCAVCHSMGKNKLTGPGLAGVAGRIPEGDWINKWIKNSKGLIDSGDPYANEIAKFDPSVMPPFTYLSDEAIAAIADHVINPPAPEVVAGASDATGSSSAEPESNSMGVLLAIIAVLVIAMFTLRAVRNTLNNVVNKNKGLPLEESTGIIDELKDWMGSNKTKTGLIVLFALGGLSSSGWYALKEIGIYEGYHPTQPIEFSHKIHAGDNDIDCQYCHSTASKSKTSGIPTVNVCMNCHKGISEGPSGEKGTAEIAKIYEAAGWDFEKGEYNKPQKPIKWVKVHNLPDFVFFSHQQHVNVGKQECETCHGDVKSMTTVKQHSQLTMKWCIDCHNETEVPGMKDNPYYEKLHKTLAAKYKDQPITVAKMGGIECAKCHY